MIDRPDTRPPAPAPVPAPADGRPQVALPGGGMPTWVIACLAVAIALVVMLALHGPRTARVRRADPAYAPAATPPLPPALDAASTSLLYPPTTPRTAGAFAVRLGPRLDTPPPFAAPFAAPPAPPGAMSTSEAPATAATRFPTQPMPGAPTPGTSIGMSGQARGTGGSAVVYDAGQGAGAGAGGLGEDKGGDATIVRASLIRNRPMVIAQGEILSATLETPVASSRPGPIRAVVSRDVRGFDGAHVLIPRGSRLIGDYRAAPGMGRRRILATWTRLIRPDGVSIRIDSPAADAVGGAGIPGRVDTHFLARFANAALQSALQIGVNIASRAGSGSVIVANTPQVSASMGQNIVPGADEPPTVSVREGAAISVFVARDLDFSGVPAAR